LIYLLQHRSELTQVYQNFQKVVQTQFSRTNKIFRSDNTMEYNEKSFLNFLKQHRTMSHRSCPYTSQQNGYAECKHLHILDTVQALLISASLPECFWGEADIIAVYTINRVPSPTIHNQTPYEQLNGSTPNYFLLKIFGCIYFVTLPAYERTKLESRSHLCCFLGYGLTQKRYRYYDPVTRRLRISHHVEFWEHKMFTSQMQFSASSSTHAPVFTEPSIILFLESSTNTLSSSDEPSPTTSNLSNSTDDHLATSHIPEFSQEPRRSTKVRTPLAHLHEYHYFFALATLHEPHSYREASADPLLAESYV
jgi:hypothetical protein